MLGITLADKVNLRVIECEPAVKGDTATSASKNATVETGLQVKVPLFIKENELITISTSDGKYSGRAN
jgi:elongation factor P